MPRRWHVAASLSLSLSLCRPSEGKVYQPSRDACLVARLSLSLNLDIIAMIAMSVTRSPVSYEDFVVVDSFQITTIWCYEARSCF